MHGVSLAMTYMYSLVSRYLSTPTASKAFGAFFFFCFSVHKTQCTWTLVHHKNPNAIQTWLSSKILKSCELWPKRSTHTGRHVMLVALRNMTYNSIRGVLMWRTIFSSDVLDKQPNRASLLTMLQTSFGTPLQKCGIRKSLSKHRWPCNDDCVPQNSPVAFWQQLAYVASIPQHTLTCAQISRGPTQWKTLLLRSFAQ